MKMPFTIDNGNQAVLVDLYYSESRLPLAFTPGQLRDTYLFPP